MPLAKKWYKSDYNTMMKKPETIYTIADLIEADREMRKKLDENQAQNSYLSKEESLSLSYPISDTIFN